jgi:3'-phosphoadenosine 5'-phosphosulfate sulfotransferase (PAPS reductase)/FAD synthetase
MTVASFDACAVPQQLIDSALATIRNALAQGTRAIVAWSGGKDGLVAGLLARDLGITDCCCDESFYFERQKDDVRDTARLQGVDVRYYDRLNMAWLAANQRLCFPYRDTKAFDRFCELRQRTTMHQHALLRGADIIITGRKQVGNMVKAPLYRKGAMLMCHPIYNWRDPHVWGFLQQRGVPRPWIYSTVIGQKEGNTPWTLFRRFADMAQNWAAVASVDMAPIRAAAPFNIRGAADYLAQHA